MSQHIPAMRPMRSRIIIPQGIPTIRATSRYSESSPESVELLTSGRTTEECDVSG